MAEPKQYADRFDGEVPAALPLSLLEAVRAHDRPDEVLEDENLTVSLPRRFGLTDVVDTQIRQFEAAQKAGRNVRLDDVVNLMRLVLRRPDAAPIMQDTGRRFADWHFQRKSAASRALYPRLPLRLSSAAAARAVAKELKILKAGNAVTVTRQPFHVRIDGSMFARIDADGAACPFITGMLQQTLRHYCDAEAAIVQTSCSASGNARCEWEGHRIS